MKKYGTIILLSVLLCLCMAGWAGADIAIGTRMEIVGAQQQVWLYENPEYSDNVVAALPLYEEVVWLSLVENGYAQVATQYGRGYVREENLKALPSYAGRTVDDQLTADQRYNINLFLSNFTEADFAWGTGYFDMDDEVEMVEFAINHIWFNQQDKIEWVDGHEEGNVRLKEEYIAPVAEKYFGRAPLSAQPKWAVYKDGYYYWTETGGHVASGFAQITSVRELENGYYEVYFETYGGGMAWTNDCCGLTLDQAREKYPDNYPLAGYALLEIGDINDRATYRLLRYAYA